MASCVASVRVANGDTPANCTYNDVLGTWKFYIGPTGLDRTVNCTIPWTPEKTLVVSLLFPDKVTDQFLNEGFWTMIYNQGFEVQLQHRKYFAFSNFTSGENNTVTSYCDSTFAGWSHDFSGHNWACYFGRKVDSNPIAKTHLTSRHVPYDFKYVVNRDFTKKINSAQTLWTATDYP